MIFDRNKRFLFRIKFKQALKLKSKMKKIVLLRHGESLWNKENRFTGWTDVDLSDKGVEEGYEAGNLLKEAGISFQMAYASYLKRAVKL